MKLLHLAIGLTAALNAIAADTVTLKDGRVVAGNYLGGSAREVRIEG